jgi:very-short-patch-repair endonuclease
MNLRERAKRLRSHQTEAEQRLWYHLRAHRLMGLKFRRQKPLGRYIVDFLCHECRLIIEVDGGQHATQTAYDQARDVWLREQGYQVLRFWNHEVMQELDGVLERIRSVVEPSPPAPPPHAGEGSKSLVEPSPPRAGEERKDDATGHASPLPPAGEG